RPPGSKLIDPSNLIPPVARGSERTPTMSATTEAGAATGGDGYDRRREELQAFDDTKAGVKGLVDAGVTAVPAIFRHPPDALRELPPTPSPPPADARAAIPVVDLSGGAPREEVVARVRRAAGTAGF